MMRFLPILVLLTGVLVAVGLSCVYIVDERQQALLLAFGKVEQVVNRAGSTEETVASSAEAGITEVQGPGLYFKLPAPLNTVVFYEKRILALETRDLEVNPLDNRRLVVNAFARWRIVDPLRFREAVQTQLRGEARLEEILTDGLREVLGKVNSDNILSADRAALMRQIREDSRPRAEALGVEIVDVRIRRADLPEQNLNATYERMKAERQQEAADERARGREAAQVRVAEAERQAVELESEARRKAEVIRGEADAERNRVFAEAYGKDEEFFAFYRSLRAYENSLKGQNSTIVLSPDSEFFEYLGGGAIRKPRQ